MKPLKKYNDCHAYVIRYLAYMRLLLIKQYDIHFPCMRFKKCQQQFSERSLFKQQNVMPRTFFLNLIFCVTKLRTYYMTLARILMQKYLYICMYVIPCIRVCQHFAFLAFVCAYFSKHMALCCNRCAYCAHIHTQILIYLHMYIELLLFDIHIRKIFAFVVVVAIAVIVEQTVKLTRSNLYTCNICIYIVCLRHTYKHIW